MNLNTQFVFENKTKRLLIGGMALGVVCLLYIFMTDDEYHTRFWTSWLHNSVFFSGIAFMSMFFLSAQITAFAGWNSVVNRVWQAMSQFMWVGIILMAVIVLGVWGHFHHLYHWNTPGITDPENPIYDKVIAGKSGFLNPVWFTIGTVGFLALWYYWARSLRNASLAQDEHETEGFKYYKIQRKWAASFLPIGGFLSTVFLWQSVMSVDPHWYSTMFAWYSMISVWIGSLGLTVMLIIYLKSLGYLEYVNQNHLHDIGKFIFGISVFWTYLWFDQFMLIWYANNGEETIYFNQRMTHYPVLFWGNLLMNFVAPFLILMRNDTKRKFGTMFFVALIVFFGHWWDYFYMIKPGARIAAHEAKEIAEGKHGGHEKHETHISEADHHSIGEEHASEAEHAVGGHETESAEEMTDDHGTEAAEMNHEENHNETEGVTDNTESHEPSEIGEEMEAEADHATAEAAVEHHDEHGEGHHGHEPFGFKMGFTVPGIEDIGVLIGFLSLFLYFFFGVLGRASLVPMKDPYLEESLHHDTGALVEGEEGGDSHH